MIVSANVQHGKKWEEAIQLWRKFATELQLTLDESHQSLPEVKGIFLDFHANVNQLSKGKQSSRATTTILTATPSTQPLKPSDPSGHQQMKLDQFTPSSSPPTSTSNPHKFVTLDDPYYVDPNNDYVPPTDPSYYDSSSDNSNDGGAAGGSDSSSSNTDGSGAVFIPTQVVWPPPAEITFPGPSDTSSEETNQDATGTYAIQAESYDDSNTGSSTDPSSDPSVDPSSVGFTPTYYSQIRQSVSDSPDISSLNLVNDDTTGMNTMVNIVNNIPTDGGSNLSDAPPPYHIVTTSRESESTIAYYDSETHQLDTSALNQEQTVDSTLDSGESLTLQGSLIKHFDTEQPITQLAEVAVGVGVLTLAGEIVIATEVVEVTQALYVAWNIRAVGRFGSDLKTYVVQKVTDYGTQMKANFMQSTGLDQFMKVKSTLKPATVKPPSTSSSSSTGVHHLSSSSTGVHHSSSSTGGGAYPYMSSSAGSSGPSVASSPSYHTVVNTNLTMVVLRSTHGNGTIQVGLSAPNGTLLVVFNLGPTFYNHSIDLSTGKSVFGKLLTQPVDIDVNQLPHAKLQVNLTRTLALTKPSKTKSSEVNEASTNMNNLVHMIGIISVNLVILLMAINN